MFIQSSASLVQQLTAGSLDIALSTGLADPIRAIDKGGAIAIVRIEMQAPPYALLAKPAIKTWSDLKGKTISIGGPKDITRIYLERMAVPNGVKPGDYDTVFAGATSARFSALTGGAVDAAILLPPFNFYADGAGFNSLGLTVDYAEGTAVRRGRGQCGVGQCQQGDAGENCCGSQNKSIAWFEDEQNCDGALRILKSASSLNQDDVYKAYKFFRDGHFFEPTGKVSRSKLNALAKAMESLGDLPGALDVDKLVLPA